MLKETIQFTDFNDNPATTVEYFNLTKNELVDLEDSVEGGLSALIRRIQDNPTPKGVLDLLKVIAHASYGIKSPDGKYFEKSDEIKNRFIHSAFYDDFLFGLVENDANKGLAFIRGVIPAKLLESAEAQLKSMSEGSVEAQTYDLSARERFAAAQAASAESGTIVQQPVGAFGQPALAVQESPVDARAPQPYPGPQNDAEWNAFQQWQAQQQANKATQVASAPASPDAFRVREEEPLQGLPRPPHEQIGDAQP